MHRGYRLEPHLAGSARKAVKKTSCNQPGLRPTPPLKQLVCHWQKGVIGYSFSRLIPAPSRANLFSIAS
jgi:hypothetical protein